MSPTSIAIAGRMAAIAITAGASGLCCSKAEGAPFECECEWLTDFDDAATQAVRVCARDEPEAIDTARGCAQLATPAPIQKCACSRASPAATPCRAGCRD